MCSGTALLYGIPKIVIGENHTFKGPESYLKSRRIEVVVLDRLDCMKLMSDFINAHPDLWFEDIGE
jgi:cytosine deaminase